MDQQMRASLETIRDILKLAGMDMEHVVDAHVYLKDIGEMDMMNKVFTEYFPKNPPVRTTVQAIMDNLVQVQAVAVR
jgi:2-iminobutanoate/2-iminopropanoate deaminase